MVYYVTRYVPSACDVIVYVDPYILKELYHGLAWLRGRDQRGTPWEQVDASTVQAILNAISNIVVEERIDICYCMSDYITFCKKYCREILRSLEENGIKCKRRDCKETYNPKKQLDDIIEIAEDICREPYIAPHNPAAKLLNSICNGIRMLERVGIKLCYQRDVGCDVTWQYLLRNRNRCFGYLLFFTEREALCEHCQSISCVAAALCGHKNVLLSLLSSQQLDPRRVAATNYNCEYKNGVLLFCRQT